MVRSEIHRDFLKNKIQNGQTAPRAHRALTPDAADDTDRVVAMIGVEPFQAALDAGAEIVIAGRSSDAAIYAAIPVRLGMDPGLAWHMGKIIECGAQVVEPREGQDCVIGTLYDDYFTIEPDIRNGAARGLGSPPTRYMKIPAPIY